VKVETIDFDRALPRPRIPELGDGGAAKGQSGQSGMLNVGGTGTAVPFSGRQGPGRARLVRREGGTVESEKAVEQGLDWISRHQNPDGSWNLDIRARCTNSGCPGTTQTVSDAGATGLALLPLLGAGHLHTEKGRYQGTLERGLAWIVAAQRPDGAIDPGGSVHTHMYAHAIATMALAEAYGMSRDKRLREPTAKAVGYIIKAQSPTDGGWRYEPMQPGDTSVLGWQLFALRSANMSGIRVPRNTISRSKKFLDMVATDRSKTTYRYMPTWPATETMTAEALVSRQILGWPRDFPSLRKGAAAIHAHLMNQPHERNIYYWYYATQLLHNLGGPDWEKWNPRMRDTLVAMQVTGSGCDRGSWDPLDPAVDRWGRNSGRLYQTSLSVLTLEVYYRYLPLYKDQGGQIDAQAKDEAEEAGEDKAEPEEADIPKMPEEPPVQDEP
jgi:hypothetical protein